MARKKSAEGGGNNAPWLNTFADLMNLLLCFFIMLFAFSDVNTEKFNEISISMANSIGVFEAGGSSIGMGQLISSGMSQLTELDQYFNTMGKSSEGTADPSDKSNPDKGVQGSQGSESIMEGQEGAQGSQNTQGTQGAEGSQSTQDNQAGEGSQGTEGTQGTSTGGNVGIDQAMERIQEEMVNVTSKMYDQVSNLSDQYNLGDYVELSIDPGYQFVQLTLKGSVLFDSGSADIKEGAKPILSKVGELLKNFSSYDAEIVGHTDNVPMNGGAYKDNNWLSSARALNAAEYLIDICGLDPATLKYSGRGEYEPVSSNATADGRANNRRIEIKIYNQYSGK